MVTKLNYEKTKICSEVFFMAFEGQQLVGKVENNMMVVE